MYTFVLITSSLYTLMNIFTRVGAAITIASVSVSSGFAMSIPATEPVGVFLRGGNLEWSMAHAEAKQSSATHRVFHKNAEGERVLWMQSHAELRGTKEYNLSYRNFMQNRNLSHRQWHMEAAGQMKPENVQSGVLRIFYTESAVTIVAPEGLDVSIGRSFLGSRPSRRTIVLETIEQQKQHALTVGQQQ